MLRTSRDAFGTRVDETDVDIEHGKGQCPSLRMDEPFLWSWGRLSGGQGMRSDLLDLIKRVDSGAMLRDILRDTDTLVTVARHTKYLELLVATKETRTPKPNIVLTDMQQKLAKRLLNGKVRPNNIRGVVHWIWSYSSATGKSTFLDYIASQTNVVIGCEKWADTIKSIQDDTKVVWFNLPRSTTVGEFKKHYLKQFEMLSDGGLMADPKYTSRTKRVDVQCVVSCNMNPFRFRLLLPDRIEAWEFAVLTGSGVGHRRNLDTALDREKALAESESLQDGVDVNSDDYAPREMGSTGSSDDKSVDTVDAAAADDALYFGTKDAAKDTKDAAKDDTKDDNKHKDEKKDDTKAEKKHKDDNKEVENLCAVCGQGMIIPCPLIGSCVAYLCDKNECYDTHIALHQMGGHKVPRGFVSPITSVPVGPSYVMEIVSNGGGHGGGPPLVLHRSSHPSSSSSSSSSAPIAPVSLHGTTLGVRRGPAKPKVRKSVADEYAMSDDEKDETPLYRRCPTLGCSNMITGSHTVCRYHWGHSRIGNSRLPTKISCDSCDKPYFPHHLHTGIYRKEKVFMCSKCSSVCGDCGKRIWRAKQRRCGACWIVLGKRRRKEEESSSEEDG